MAKSKLIRCWLFVVFILIHSTGSSQNPGLRLVKDIRKDYTPTSINWKILGNNKSILFFQIDDGIHGTELWASDGTIDGTYIVKDISPGKKSSEFWSFTVYDSLAFFSVDDGINGREPWITDGTPNGTHLLADLAEESSNPREFHLFDTFSVCKFDNPDKPFHDQLARINLKNGDVEVMNLPDTKEVQSSIFQTYKTNSQLLILWTDWSSSFSTKLLEISVNSNTTLDITPNLTENMTTRNILYANDELLYGSLYPGNDFKFFRSERGKVELIKTPSAFSLQDIENIRFVNDTLKITTLESSLIKEWIVLSYEDSIRLINTFGDPTNSKIRRSHKLGNGYLVIDDDWKLWKLDKNSAQQISPLFGASELSSFSSINFDLSNSDYAYVTGFSNSGFSYLVRSDGTSNGSTILFETGVLNFSRMGAIKRIDNHLVALQERYFQSPLLLNLQINNQSPDTLLSLNEVNGNSYPGNFVIHDGELWFSARSDKNSSDIWSTNGPNTVLKVSNELLNDGLAPKGSRHFIIRDNNLFSIPVAPHQGLSPVRIDLKTQERKILNAESIFKDGNLKEFRKIGNEHFLYYDYNRTYIYDSDRDSLIRLRFLYHGLSNIHPLREKFISISDGPVIFDKDTFEYVDLKGGHKIELLPQHVGVTGDTIYFAAHWKAGDSPIALWRTTKSSIGPKLIGYFDFHSTVGNLHGPFVVGRDLIFFQNGKDLGDNTLYIANSNEFTIKKHFPQGHVRDIFELGSYVYVVIENLFGKTVLYRISHDGSFTRIEAGDYDFNSMHYCRCSMGDTLIYTSYGTERDPQLKMVLPEMSSPIFIAAVPEEMPHGVKRECKALNGKVFVTATLQNTGLELFYSTLPDTKTGSVSSSTSTPVQHIYPNPAGNWIYFSFEEQSEIGIMDFMGHNVLSTTVEPKTRVDISRLSQGCYIVKTDSGFVGKFIKY